MKKKYWSLLFMLVVFVSCQKVKTEQELKEEVMQAERAFEQMAAHKGIAEAFAFFADTAAVIKRENDTLIVGRDAIKAYYIKESQKDLQDGFSVTVKWKPDHVSVSKGGDLAYTFGKYEWKKKKAEAGDSLVFSGIFHTVWKRQQDQSWKYVWD